MILNIIFGGAGFIGLNLSNYLLQDYEHVICYDNFYTGSKEHCMWIKSNYPSCYEYHELDITDTHSMEQLVKKLNKKRNKKGYDLRVYNLACPASPVHYQAAPMDTFLASTVGVKNVCELALALEAPMLYTSTSEIYGDPLVHPQTENYLGNVHTMGPRSCYDEGKRAGETIVYMYQQQGCQNFKIARLFNTYGVYMDPNDGRFISNFICAMIEGKKMKIHGTGDQTRSICYIEDTVNGLKRLMNSDFNGPVNIGNTTEHTVREWAHMIYDLFVKEEDEKRPLSQCVEFVDADSDDPQRRCPDISVAKKMLNWEPTYSAEEGLSLTKDYFLMIL